MASNWDELVAERQQSPQPQVAASNWDALVAERETAKPAELKPSAKDRILAQLAIPQSNLGGAIRSFGRGASLGLSDVVGEGVNALINSQITGTPFKEQFASDKNQANAERDQFRQDNPALSYGSEIAGAVASAPIAAKAIAGGTALLKGGSEAAQAGTELANIVNTGKDIVEAIPIATNAAKSSSVALQAVKGLSAGATQGGIYGATEADSGSGLSGAGIGALTGAVIGGTLPVVGNALKSVISPAASTNPQLQSLIDAGVKPTIGQALGGIPNKIEQKAQSIPLVGEVIASKRAAARSKAAEVFNNEAINKVLAPIGQKVNGAGQDAVAEAAKKASSAYSDALGKINGVMFDDTFHANVGELRSLVNNLSDDQVKRFDKILANEVNNRMSPSGGMIPEAYKKADSALGGIAANASDRELGSAVKQLQDLLKQQMMRSNPEVATDLKSADTAYALLTRVESAASKAADKEGVFTPKQLLQASKEGDKSARKRAVAHGDALMQEFAQESQKRNAILADTVANSGTADRAAQMLSGGALFTNPIATIGTAGAGLTMYSQPVQNALLRAVSTRGAWAEPTGEAVNALTQLSSTPSILITEDMLNQGNSMRVPRK